MTKRWQTDIADCVSIQDEFMRAANGKRIAKDKQKEPKALMDAIEGSSVSPSIHRGNRFNAADIDKLKVGKAMILPPGSWTASPRIAGQFAKNPSRRKVIPVVFHVPSGAKTLPIEKFGDPSHKNEREYISAGQFKILKVSKRGGVTHVDLEHTAMFSWKGAQGEDAS